MTGALFVFKLTVFLACYSLNFKSFIFCMQNGMCLSPAYLLNFLLQYSQCKVSYAIPCFKISSSSLLRPFCIYDCCLLSFPSLPIPYHSARDSSFHLGIFLPTTYCSLFKTYFSFYYCYFFCHPYYLSLIALSWLSSSVSLCFVESNTLTGPCFIKILAQIFSCLANDCMLKDHPQPTEHG